MSTKTDLKYIQQTENKQPKYRCYKPKNLAVVRIDGKDHYLGKFNSSQSWEKYHSLLAAKLIAATKPVKNTSHAELTINELLNAYRVFAEGYYVRYGKLTKEYVDMKYAARPLRKLFGSSLVSEIGPLSLKAVRQHMVDEEKLSRRVINHRINRIKRIFKWGVAEELVPPGILHGLQAVTPIGIGSRSSVRWHKFPSD